MKAINMLSKLTAEAIDLKKAFLINGENLFNGRYSQLFPINSNSELDDWFLPFNYYFCLYGKIDDEFFSLGEPDFTAFSKNDEEVAIHFWIIDD